MMIDHLFSIRDILTALAINFVKCIHLEIGLFFMDNDNDNSSDHRIELDVK